MTGAVIVDVVRTAGGIRHGRLAGWHPVDLAAEVLKSLTQRNDLDPAEVDDVIMGCVMQVGAQGLNLGRNAVLAAGWPEAVPAVTIDRQCGSAQQAVHFAAQGVMSGAYEVVVAAGVEVMSLVPLGASGMVPAVGAPLGPTVARRYAAAGGLVPQGISADLVARQWRLSRQDLDTYAAQSHQRAARATAEGRFAAEIVPVAGRARDKGTGRPIDLGEVVIADEGIRPAATTDVLGRLKPAFAAGSVITAGNSSQIADGAAAALVMSQERCASRRLTARARFHAFALAGVDPVTMLTGPVPATRKVLERAKLGIDDIDLFEVNEDFASVVLAWEREIHPDMARVNVNGGAISLGHPVGASGTRLLATLVNELERTGGRWGLQTMSESGGMANAMVVERLG
ncbi:MAG: thiolase family protein [Acidimicrobiales bacterium]